jgi:hypothetical protein
MSRHIKEIFNTERYGGMRNARLTLQKQSVSDNVSDESYTRLKAITLDRQVSN